MSETREDLRNAIESLEQALGNCRVKAATLLRDVIAIDLAGQVLNAAEATEIVADSSVPDMAYLTARHAFEGACDLMYLLEAAEEPNLLAARAYVSAHVAARRNVGHLNTSAEAIGDPLLNTPPGLATQIENDRNDLDALVPGTGRWLDRAHALVQRGGPRHWTGLERTNVIDKVCEKRNDPALRAMLYTYWNVVSSKSHPHGRVGQRVHLTQTQLTLERTPARPDDGPASVAAASAATAAVVLMADIGSRGNGESHATASGA